MGCSSKWSKPPTDPPRKRQAKSQTQPQPEAQSQRQQADSGGVASGERHGGGRVVPGCWVGAHGGASFW